MNLLKISIIVPVYNVENYIRECIQSILDQSFTDFELILVDDGSTDACSQICDFYAASDSRIKVIHKKNGGQSDARNVGLTAIGDGLSDKSNLYVAFVDSDDRMSIDALKHLYEKAISSQADIVLGNVVRFTEEGCIRPYTRLDYEVVMQGKEALKLILEGKELNISMCGGLIRYDVIKDIKMPVGWICEDWYVMPKLYFKAKKVLYTPLSWYEYRDNPDSTMGTIVKKVNPQVIDVAQHVISEIRGMDRQLYKRTLWSNMKRVWKYVGIVYSRGSCEQEKRFLILSRQFFKKYFIIAVSQRTMSVREIIGVWSFCYCDALCSFLYRTKNKSFKKI